MHHDRRTVAIMLTWVDIKNAEYEVVQRLRRAAHNCDVDVIIVDNDGYKIWSTTAGRITDQQRLTQADCDFCLSLHFESPKVFDVYTYAALWNPPDFYFGPGYKRAVTMLASHDAVLSCHSSVADNHARSVFAGLARRELDASLPTLFHSVPEPHLPPCVTENSRLFYIGINWERITGQRGRHHELLDVLDKADLLDIYGPKVFLGIEPWAGYKCYRHEIPFDGESVVKRVHESGICLAFSSEAHQKSGIMSNRLFEALGAGAVIIANPHPFIDRYFADCVHIVDDSQDPVSLAAEVRDLVLAIRRDPAAAMQTALTAQQRFKDMFTLEGCLRQIVDQHDVRLARAVEARRRLEGVQVTVLIEYHGLMPARIEEMLAVVSGQAGCVVDVAVICDRRLEQKLATSIATQPGSAIRTVTWHCDDIVTISTDLQAGTRRSRGSGAAMIRALHSVVTPFFCFLQQDDFWFADHLHTLGRALEAQAGSFLAASGKIIEDKTETGLTRRLLDAIVFENLATLAHASLPREIGRFLYRSTLLEAPLSPTLAILDGFHNRHFSIEAVLRGDLAQTGQATYLHRRWAMEEIDLFYPETKQADFVLDAFRGDPRWLRFSAQFTVQAPVATVQAAPSVTTGVFYDCKEGGDGLVFLRTGFSHPERHFVWMDGDRARLDFLVEDAPVDHEIVLLAAGRPSRSGHTQRLSLSVNGHPTTTVDVDDTVMELRFPLPAGIGAHNRRLSVVLTLAHAEEVRDDQDAILDARRLGLRLLEFGYFKGQARTRSDDDPVDVSDDDPVDVSDDAAVDTEAPDIVGPMAIEDEEPDAVVAAVPVVRPLWQVAAARLPGARRLKRALVGVARDAG